MGARDAPEHDNGNTLRYRVGELEKELERQRERVHALMAEQAALRLLLQRVSDQLETLHGRVDDDIKEIKGALLRFLFAVMVWVLGLAATIFMLVREGV